MIRAALALAATLATAAGLAVPAAAAPAAHHHRWQSWGREAQHDVGGGYVVRANMWNCPCGPQLTWADRRWHWGVTTRQPRGNTAVLSYPDIQRTTTLASGADLPVSRLAAVRSRFAETFPHLRGVRAQAAYDVWLDGYNKELMIWTDTWHRTPAGHRAGSVRVYGVRWDEWYDPPGGGDGPVFTFVRHRSVRHGWAHILSMIRVLQHQHRLGPRAGLSDVEFGFELASTGGRWLTFTVTRYQLAVQVRR